MPLYLSVPLPGPLRYSARVRTPKGSGTALYWLLVGWWLIPMWLVLKWTAIGFWMLGVLTWRLCVAGVALVRGGRQR